MLADAGCSTFDAPVQISSLALLYALPVGWRYGLTKPNLPDAERCTSC